MKTYLVGGAVRNELLGLPVHERDWVVVGGSVVEMVKQGFRQVGKSFPVFLHPETNEEYALARTECKIGPGYTGFEFNATASVTIEEDLRRRDLTINAIAKMPSGELIDPYDGVRDLSLKILRHVSPAFVEDPVRLLRVARFASQFAGLGFTVAPETIKLMQRMVSLGEVDHLVPERVWRELELALKSTHPQVFFHILSDCHAMPVLFPQLKSVDALARAVSMTDDTSVRVAALFLGVDRDAVSTVCRLYKIPSLYQDLALLCTRHCHDFNAILTAEPRDLLDVLLSLDVFRREQRFEKFLLVCQLYLGGGKEQAMTLRSAYRACLSVSVQDLVAKGLTGSELAQQIYQSRLNVLTKQAY